MKRISMIVLLLIATAIISTGSYSTLQLLNSNESNEPAKAELTPCYTIIRSTESVAELLDYSKSVAIVRPTGGRNKTEYSGVSFRLTEVEVIKTLSGEKLPNKLSIFQTEGLVVDIDLLQGKEYILFLNPYVPGVEEAIGTYVIQDANMGTFELASDGRIVEYVYRFGDEKGDRMETAVSSRSSELVSMFAQKKISLSER